MYYFLPAWFKNDSRPFYNVAPPWYRAERKIEFDDTINQIKMFANAKEKTKLLIIGYTPHLRSFLHRQELDETPYFSVFDELQNVELRGSRRVMLSDLAFPPEAEYIYQQFKILVYLAGKLYAQVELGTLGEINSVTLATKQYVFDDRGFLSSILYTTAEGALLRQDYLDLAGKVRFSEDLKTGQVTLNMQGRSRKYPSLQALVTEHLQETVAQIKKTDTVILAAGGKRTKLLLELLDDQKIVMTYFAGRNKDIRQLQNEPVEKATLAIADTKETAALIAPLYPKEKLKIVTPFDTRLRLGHSQRLAKDRLFFLVAQITPQTFVEALEQLLPLLAKRQDLFLEIGIFDRDRYELKKLQNQLEAKVPDFKITTAEDKVSEGENRLEEVKYLNEIHLRYVDSEDEMIQALDQARLLIDLGEPLELYAQIAAISAGIPQINLSASPLVEHGKNGFVLAQKVEDLPKAVDHYTSELKYWNEAMMYAVAKITELTSGNLVKQWRKWLETKE